MPILAVSDASARDKVLWCQILLPQREAAAAMGMGSTRGNIQSLFFSASLLGSLSHFTSLHLPFPAFCTIGQSLLLCACTGVLLEFPSHCSTPLQVEALFSGVSIPQVRGCSDLGSSVGACCLLGGLPHQCAAGLICSSLALSLLFFQQEHVHL